MQIANYTEVKPNNFGYKELSPSTIVSINLSGVGSDPNTRVAVNTTVRLADLPVVLDSLDSDKAPSYPQEKIDKINNSSMSIAEKLDAITYLINDYTAMVEEYESQSNENKLVLDEIRLLLAVREYLIQNEGFARDASESKPYIEASDMQVTIIKTPNGDSVASVSGTSVWG